MRLFSLFGMNDAGILIRPHSLRTCIPTQDMERSCGKMSLFYEVESTICIRSDFYFMFHKCFYTATIRDGKVM